MKMKNRKRNNVLVLALAAFVVGTPARSAPAQPNVLLIISDDQGIGDFGFMGNKDVKTPNLDRLAAQSAVFDNFVVGPACSPTRAALMTGRNHMKAGVWGVGTRNNLLRDETLMPAFFKAAGYGTGYFGKRDGVYLLEMEAWHRGCDEASHVTGYIHKDATSLTHQGMVPRKGWTCDVDVDTSLDYIRRKRGDGPWWCTTAFILPHLPWECDEKLAQPYRDAGHSELLADFYGCVTQLDDAVGRLLRGLEELGEADDTIIVFLSDNGPSYKDMSEADIASRNPLGLQGSKATAWDNGIRVPLLVRWPGRVKPGNRPQFATVEDILPTLLDLADIAPPRFPPHLPFDGISVKSAILDPAAPQVEREVFRIAISGEGSAGGKRGVVNDPAALPMEEQHVVLRGPRFKFHSFAGGKTALYDLQADPGEKTDVSAQYPEVAARYAAGLKRQYGEIVGSGRAYRLPVFKVGEKRAGANEIGAGSPQKIGGGLKAIGFTGLSAFGKAGDWAEYGIEVERPGRYEVHLAGKAMDAAPGWTLEILGKPLPLIKGDATRVCYGPVELPAGAATVKVSVDAASLPGKGSPELSKILFYPKR